MEIQTEDFTAQLNVAYLINGANVNLPPIKLSETKDIKDNSVVMIKNIGATEQMITPFQTDKCDTPTILPQQSVHLIFSAGEWFDFNS